MKQALFLFATLLCLQLNSCSTDDTPEPDPEPDYTAIDVVTGLDFSDDNGNPLGRWKSPNNNPGNIKTFPNPNTGTVHIFSAEKIARVWLVPAGCMADSVTVNIPGLSKTLSYTTTELENVQIKDIPVASTNSNISLNFEDVNAGFYRVFFQLEAGGLFWENLYIDPAATNFPGFDFLDDLCN